MAAPIIHVSFRLLEIGLDSDVVTARLGRAPTSTWRKGDGVGGSTLTRAESGWSIDAPPERTWDAGDHVERFITELGLPAAAVRDLLRDIARRAEVSVVAYVSDRLPSLSLSRELIQALANLGASIDIDIITTA